MSSFVVSTVPADGLALLCTRASADTVTTKFQMLHMHLTDCWTCEVNNYCCQTSNVNHTLVGGKIVDDSGVAGESPVSAAPTTSSFST